jgi:hypothetical protein
MKKILFIALLIFSATALQAQWGSFNGVITTNPITDIDFETATGNGTIALETADPDVTERGFVWNTTGTPETTDSKVSETGTWDDSQEWTYDLSMTGLDPNQVYYVRAYIINLDGTQYGNEVSFATIPTLGEWGLIALGSLVALFGGWFVYRKFV